MITTWKQQRERENDLRRQWLIETAGQFETGVAMAEAIQIERSAMFRMAKLCGLVLSDHLKPKSPPARKKVPRKPKPPVITMDDLPPKLRAQYDALRREFRISHKEALRRLLEASKA